MSAATAIDTPVVAPVAIGRPRARLLLLIAANVVGVFAFLWPFVLPALAGPAAENHKADGPWILLGLGAILAALLFLELGRGGMGPKVVALIGVLGAAIVALRLPGYVAGFSAMFIVLLVAGNAFGPSFGFLLGAVGMFASGLFVGGLARGCRSRWWPSAGWAPARACCRVRARPGGCGSRCSPPTARSQARLRRRHEPVDLAVHRRRLGDRVGSRRRAWRSTCGTTPPTTWCRRSGGTSLARSGTRCWCSRSARRCSRALDRAAKRMRLTIS